MSGAREGKQRCGSNCSGFNRRNKIQSKAKQNEDQGQDKWKQTTPLQASQDNEVTRHTWRRQLNGNQHEKLQKVYCHITRIRDMYKNVKSSELPMQDNRSSPIVH